MLQTAGVCDLDWLELLVNIEIWGCTSLGRLPDTIFRENPDAVVHQPLCEAA